MMTKCVCWKCKLEKTLKHMYYFLAIIESISFVCSLVASLVVSHHWRRRFHLITYSSSASSVRSSCFLFTLQGHVVKLHMGPTTLHTKGAWRSDSIFIVIRHGTSCLHVANDVLAGVFQEITTRPLQTLHINFLLRGETVVDEVFGEDHEDCTFEDGSGICSSNVAQSRLHQLHEGSMRDEIFQRNLWGLIGWITLVVKHDSHLMLHKFGGSPPFLEDSLLVANIAEGFLLLDQLPPISPSS